MWSLGGMLHNYTTYIKSDTTMALALEQKTYSGWIQQDRLYGRQKQLEKQHINQMRDGWNKEINDF